MLPLILLAGSLLAACSDPPTLKALAPPDGRPHDVIKVDADGREDAQIVWDVGGPDERIIPGSYGGAFMFSVPHNAAAGKTYNVALQNSDGRSASVPFNVPMTDGLPTVARPPGPTARQFPRSRIDAVTLIGAVFGSSSVDVTLYVQGANIDIGATVWLEEPGTGSSATPVLTELATVSHKVLLNNWFGVSSAELDYPIYHYSSAIVTLGVRSPGEELTLFVKNLDDEKSDPIKYMLPEDAKTVDSDGDGLLDSWETAGYDADSDGTPDLDLPGLGANPYRRDLFVELDIMDGVRNRPDRRKDGSPDSTVFDALRAMFDSAPILNYNGPPGIHLEIDYSGKPCLPDGAMDKCSWEFTMFDTSPPPEGDPDPLRTRFSKLKEKNFRDDIRGQVYHYGIWAIQDDIAVGQESSGHSDFGDDFMISFDAFLPRFQTRRSQLERLAHELGHDLGLRHGGGDDYLYKPNYLSVMSYSWDLRTGWVDADRKVFVTCLPFYYAQEGAQEMGGAVPKDVAMIVNYSEGMARALDKPATGPTNFCELPVDFTTIFSTPAVTRSEDFPNWSLLKFDGPVKGGWIP